MWFLLGLNNSYAQPQEAAELENFIDQLMRNQLEDYRIPGSVVVVVQGGDVILAKGYGFANIEKKMKVDAQASMFRIASISKLFVYTAIMQLAEEGKLDLNSSIVDYLVSAGISTDGIDKGTTLKHLITHTAGFEYVIAGAYERDAAAMRPLDAVLREQLPAQIRSPGELAAYSNSGVALLGLIIEIASGMAWTDYIAAHILEPLGMTHTTARQPVQDGLVEYSVTGYRQKGEAYEAQDFTFVPLAPAGGMSASGLDMAKFMLAHLQNGEGILQPKTAQTMYKTLFQHDPRLPGMTYGFLEKQRNEQRIIGHSGTIANFISDLWLVPEHGLGLFISYNSSRGKMAQIAFAQDFFSHYFPHTMQPTLSLHEKKLKSYTGTYRSTLINLTTPEKLTNLAQSMIVRLAGNGNLQIFSLVMPPMELQAIGDGIFQDISTGERVVIAERNGIRHVFVENWPEQAFTEITWHETPQLHFLLFATSFVVFLSAVFKFARAAFISHPAGEIVNIVERWARITSVAMSLIFIAFIVSAVYTFVVGMAFGTPAYIVVIAKILPLAVFLSLVLVILAILMWSRRIVGVGAALHYNLVALMGLVVSWQLVYFNMLAVPWQT